jgi:large subunit ribosomal protein L6
MSRIARIPIELPQGVVVTVTGNNIMIVGPKGKISYTVPDPIRIQIEDQVLRVVYSKEKALAGTTRANLENAITGVAKGFECRLLVEGVGYNVRFSEKSSSVLRLNLGYTRVPEFVIPESVTVELISNTEILIKGCDLQQVKQVAAAICKIRRPSPYNNRCIRDATKTRLRKEVKK